METEEQRFKRRAVEHCKLVLSDEAKPVLASAEFVQKYKAINDQYDNTTDPDWGIRNNLQLDLFLELVQKQHPELLSK